MTTSAAATGVSMPSAPAWADATHAEWLLARGVSIENHGDVPLLSQAVEGELPEVLQSAAARPLVAQVAQFLASAISGRKSKAVAETVAPLHMLQLRVTCQPSEALAVAVAALHAFLQLNWTGPSLPLTDVGLLRHCGSQHFPSRSVDVDEDDAYDTAYARMLHASSLDYLTYAGEPAYHLCERPFFLALSLLILEALEKSGGASSLATLGWWRFRARSVHLRILDEAVECEAPLMQAMSQLCDALQSKSDKAASDVERHAWDNLRARVLLESALAQQRAGQDKAASEQLVDAAKANGLVYQLSGALGKRTQWQKEAKTQLILLAVSREEGADRAEEAGRPAPDGSSVALHPDQTGWQAAVDPEKQVDHQPATYSLNDDTLLEQTQFTDTTSSTDDQRLAVLTPGAQPPLAVTDQCTLLALCLSIHNTQASHGLTSEQMSAFIERVISHPQNWSVHTMSLLLRSRLEATRTRTVERSTLQLQALIDQMPTNDSSLRERLRFIHALELPAKWAMQAELARRYVSLGVLRSALEIFERIELWEDVVHCLGLLGRQEEGIAVVRDLLEGRKTEADVQLQEKRISTSASQVPRTRFVNARAAKLWCLLGDLEPASSAAHYTRAWEVSERRSARAARSLGGYHFALQAFGEAAVWLRRAVRINALYTRSWFMLGCSYMRLEKWLEAAAAFRQCTSLEEEDGESWNNLASCYLRMHAAQVPRLDSVLDDNDDDDGASVSSAQDSGVSVTSDTDDDDVPREASVALTDAKFELRLLAHKALGVSLKYQFESWRVWANYMIVSMDVGLLGEAARALARVVEIRARESSLSTSTAQAAEDIIDLGVLNKLVDAVIHAPGTGDDDAASPEGGAFSGATQVGEALRPAVTRLFCDTLLPRFSTSAAVWESYARLLFSAQEYQGTLQARVQAFQCGLGDPDSTAVVTDGATWRLAVRALEDLCDVMMNLGEKPASPGRDEPAMPDWRFQARTLVRAFMARTRDSFDDQAEWDELTELLAELKST